MVNFLWKLFGIPGTAPGISGKRRLSGLTRLVFAQAVLPEKQRNRTNTQWLPGQPLKHTDWVRRRVGTWQYLCFLRWTY
jgi:hypothetical protein